LTAEEQAEIEHMLLQLDQVAYAKFKDGFENAAGQDVKLRDYQLEALQLLIRHCREKPGTMPGIQWTMGLGKSVQIAAAACLARTLTTQQQQQEEEEEDQQQQQEEEEEEDQQQQQQQQHDNGLGQQQQPVVPKTLVLVPSTLIRQQLADALRRDAPAGQFGDLQPKEAVLELGPELDPAEGRVKSFADDAMARWEQGLAVLGCKYEGRKGINSIGITLCMATQQYDLYQSKLVYIMKNLTWGALGTVQVHLAPSEAASDGITCSRSKPHKSRQ
jgi:Ni/Co efflux regulator RcnB